MIGAISSPSYRWGKQDSARSGAAHNYTPTRVICFQFSDSKAPARNLCPQCKEHPPYPLKAGEPTTTMGLDLFSFSSPRNQAALYGWAGWARTAQAQPTGKVMPESQPIFCLSGHARWMAAHLPGGRGGRLFLICTKVL